MCYGVTPPLTDRLDIIRVRGLADTGESDDEVESSGEASGSLGIKTETRSAIGPWKYSSIVKWDMLWPGFPVVAYFNENQVRQHCPNGLDIGGDGSFISPPTPRAYLLPPFSRHPSRTTSPCAWVCRPQPPSQPPPASSRQTRKSGRRHVFFVICDGKAMYSEMVLRFGGVKARPSAKEWDDLRPLSPRYAHQRALTIATHSRRPHGPRKKCSLGLLAGHGPDEDISMESLSTDIGMGSLSTDSLIMHSLMCRHCRKLYIRAPAACFSSDANAKPSTQ